jgi:YkoY family integral membrane protein
MPFFGQTFSPNDLALIALLIVLEGVLSIDNALVLALLAKRLPKEQQTKALTYGLAGAFVFRIIAIGAAAYLLRWRIVKLLGGGYLLWVAGKHLWEKYRERWTDRITVGPDHGPLLLDDATGQALTPEQELEEIRVRGPLPIDPPVQAGFWSTVVLIETTDIAFAIDSVLAAIAVVGSPPAGHTGTHPKLWVVVTGGLLGVVLMRVAAALFIRLLERFPRFETSAYLLVTLIGLKLVVDWSVNSEQHPHRVDFHDPASFAFWAFWSLLALGVL